MYSSVDRCVYDFGIVVNSDLKVSIQCEKAAMKRNQVPEMIHPTVVEEEKDGSDETVQGIGKAISGILRAGLDTAFDGGY